MAPYNPPKGDSHYSQVNVKDYNEKMILCMIGKGGEGFYKLTNYLNMKYIWYDSDRKVIELWGSYHHLKNGAKEKLEKRLNFFESTFVDKNI